MKNLILTLLSVIAFTGAIAQTDSLSFSHSFASEIDRSIVQDYNVLRPYFDEAYSLYPSIPRGMLEAVSYNYTRFHHLKPDLSQLDSNDIPATYGVMGLTLDGKGYFRENLRKVSDLSGYSAADIIASPRISIIAYAAAYAQLQKSMNVFSAQLADHAPILLELGELPLSQQRQQQFAVNSNLYAILSFFDNADYCSAIGIDLPSIHYERCFGEMFPLLQAKNVSLGVDGEVYSDGEVSTLRGADHENAIWNSAATCNYSSRNGRTVSAITIHYTQGTYASAISWFQNCSSQVSAHYVVRSSDGQITQMVREADKAWHVGNCNGYTVGIEHEAYGNIYSYFTPIMYEKSAALTRDICDRNGISPLRMFYRDTLDDGTVLNSGIHDLGGESACTKIRGHQHFPGQSHTDPGQYWNWNYYFKLVNHDTPVTTYTSVTGILTDAGGASGNYGNDVRELYLIQVDGAENITLAFSEFALEAGYDFLWIYDGNSVYAPLIGRWNTTSPGTITSSGNALLVEFRSDCATTDAGWIAQWTAHLPVVDLQPTTEIVWNEELWATENFFVQFQDADDNGIAYRFFQVMGNDGHRWTANPQQGFYCDNFDNFNTSLWTSFSGNWRVESNQLKQDMQGNATVSSPLHTDTSNVYLYDFYAGARSLGMSGGTFGIFFHSDQVNQGMARNGYLLQISPSTSEILLCRMVSGNKQYLTTAHGFTSTTDTLFYRIIHNASNGEIKVFRNGNLLLEFTDATPLAIQGEVFGFVTQNEGVVVDNLRVYRSRGNEVEIITGDGECCEACFQANQQAARTKIKSVIVDNAGNFSTLKEKLVKVDFSQPRFQGIVKQRLVSPLSVNAAKTNLTITCESATDEQSDIQGYEFVVENTSMNNRTKEYRVFSESPTFTYQFTNLGADSYSVRARALNNAGLYSPYIAIRDKGTSKPMIATTRSLELTVLPNPASDYVEISLLPSPLEESFGYDNNSCKMLFNYGDVENADYQIRAYNLLGQLMLERTLGQLTERIPIGDWAPGMYIFQVLLQNQIVGWQKVIKQ